MKMSAKLLSHWIKKTFGLQASKASTHVNERRRYSRQSRLFLERLENRDLFSANPAVQSINLTNPASPLTNASSVSYTVTFSETVTGVDATDFQLAETGALTAAITQVTPVSGSVYTVTVSGITGNGTLGLNLVNDGSIHDLAGNNLVGGLRSFQNQQTFATRSRAVSVAVADVNGDGKPDLIVANAGGNSVSVLLGNGDGTFQNPQTFATSCGSLRPWRWRT